MLCGSREGSEVSATFFAAAARAAGHKRRAAARSRASFSVGCLPTIVAANKGQFSSIISAPRNSEVTPPLPVKAGGQARPTLNEDCHGCVVVSIRWLTRIYSDHNIFFILFLRF